MPTTAVIAPGAVTSGTEITLPQPYPDIAEIVSCIHITLSDGTAAGTVTKPTATKTGRRSFTINEDTTDRSILVLVYIAKGEMSGY